MAMSQSKAIAVAQRAHAREYRRRQNTRMFEHGLIRKAAVIMTSAAYGAMKRNAVPDAIAGVPWKLGVWAGATLVELIVNPGVLKAFSAGISDASAAIYTDRSIVNKTLVSGEGGEF
jgi:hypothetical protein